MKYDFAGDLCSLTKRLREESDSKNQEISDDYIKSVRDLTGILNKCNYPELSGLRLADENIELKDKIVSTTLVNKDGMEFYLTVGANELCFYSKDGNLVVKIVSCERDLEKVSYYISIVCDNDVIITTKNSHNDLDMYAYLDAKNMEAEEGKPINLVSDYSITLIAHHDNNNNIYYYPTAFTDGNHTGVRYTSSLPLDKVRKYTLEFYNNCKNDYKSMEIRSK